ncbi:uncharacterized protein KIAA1143 homolog [Zeugodacus cucurbitae]|uniref:uncharacterized protein KIAA1143 homolog n=1 Tax=Zeugodacus cucurbitae TaxID=28588 RepID=UPI0023D929C3|nr:uncharacterized protein KIAA1143 homolog [Zeugodacus cucurbitae]
MSGKRNISYVKPQDPSFLAKLKSQIGYKEGPTVETKRQKLDFDGNSSDSDREEEKPQIVVLKSGDLTAEEVQKEEARIAKEAAEARADLSKPIVFQKRKETPSNSAALTSASSSISKNHSSNTTQTNKKGEQSEKTNKDQGSKSIKKKKDKQKSKLSFNVDEEEDDEL